ncbi:MAG: cobalt-precorrin-5B (C(1))-methyltransferase [Eisenbergiella sp.]
MFEKYVYKNQTRLRCGYTTGSCAAAAAKAAALLLVGGIRPETVELETPSGQKLFLRWRISGRKGKVSAHPQRQRG